MLTLGCASEPGAPEVPDDIAAFVEEARALDALYCDARYPGGAPDDMYEGCRNWPHFHLAAFPHGNVCFLAMARDDADLREHFRTVARCVSPYYEAARTCLAAGGDADAVDGCLDTFQDDAQWCAQSESLGALLDALGECGRCDLDMPPVGREMPTYCVDDFLEE